jgi:hypothetical protein
MSPDQIIAAAARLGIKPTRATVGSELFECWADRVREADSHEIEASYFRNEGQDCMAIQVDLQMDAAIAEADRYAV